LLERKRGRREKAAPLLLLEKKRKKGSFLLSRGRMKDVEGRKSKLRVSLYSLHST